MEILRNAIANGAFLLDAEARDLQSIFDIALNHAVSLGSIDKKHLNAVEDALCLREQQISTAIGHSVAVPHAYLDLLNEPIIVFVRLARPLFLGAPDGIPTRFVFLLLGPEDGATQHLDVLTSIARLMSDEEFRYDARLAQSSENLLQALDRFEKRTSQAKMSVADQATAAFASTGRIFGGVLQDLKRRAPNYLSDYRDGLHLKSVSATLFLFFACLAPAVTFGGIMAELTGNQIGVAEMIIASAFCGTVYALLAGQPLVILGGTGPLLIFTMILYDLCGEIGLQEHFLATRAWIGLWSALLLIVLAMTDASCLMRFFTRFTDEVFAALISIIFIAAAVEALVRIFQNLKQTEHHDTAFLSLLLALGTLYIAT